MLTLEEQIDILADSDPSNALLRWLGDAPVCCHGMLTALYDGDFIFTDDRRFSYPTEDCDVMITYCPFCGRYLIEEQRNVDSDL